ncbi:hypothetical protein RI367_005459 [Sorochytrium milnesiophthora]
MSHINSTRMVPSPCQSTDAAISLARLDVPRFPGYEAAQLNRETTIACPFLTNEELIRAMSVKRPHSATAAAHRRKVVCGDTAALEQQVSDMLLASQDASKQTPTPSLAADAASFYSVDSAVTTTTPSGNAPSPVQSCGTSTSSLRFKFRQGDSAASLPGVRGSPVGLGLLGAFGRSIADLRKGARQLRKDPKKQSRSASPAPSAARTYSMTRLIGGRASALLKYLSDKHGLDERKHQKSLVSHAYIGVADVVVEERRIGWFSQPIVDGTDVNEPLDKAAPIGASPDDPWSIDVSSYMPKCVEYPYEIAVEVPRTSIYRQCYHCSGDKAAQCSECTDAEGTQRRGSAGTHRTRRSCSSTDQANCSVCQGRGYIRLFLALRCIWTMQCIRVLDTNGYPVSESDLSAATPLHVLTDIDDIRKAAHSLPAPLNNDVVTFHKFLRTRSHALLPQNKLLSSFSTRILVFPVVETVYMERSLLWNRKSTRRWLVIGHGGMRISHKELERLQEPFSFNKQHDSAHAEIPHHELVAPHRVVLRLKEKDSTPWMTFEGVDLPGDQR